MATARKDDIQLSIMKQTAGLIGVKSPRTINNLTTPAAKRMAELYPSARDEILELRPWSSARRQFDLPRAENSSDSGPGLLYHLPQDMVRLEDVAALNWRRDGDFIRAANVHGGDTSCLKILYNSNYTDVIYSASLKALMAAELAIKCSMAIKQSAAASQMAQSNYNRAMVKASSYEASNIGAWEGIPYSSADLLTIQPETFLDSGRRYLASSYENN